ncbi:hypothetical protein EMCRGX_G027206 [Ephydatia muelleri]|eukprot:Em0014g276a
MPGLVTRLTWTSGQNYVYAITSTSVVQVHIEQCSSFTDCLSCAANVNPLCGWCTVEQKCSRRSQCLSNTVSARWVQGNTSQCLSNTSVTPTTFTSERPTNITLIISSGLPSPLTGESFLCLLSTGNGVPISVPCSQVSQTTITSNITGAILKLKTPKLVVTFSFASFFLNIPFAMNSNNLTAYNCPLFPRQSSLTQVNCTSSAQNVTGVGMVTVYIDNEVTINNAVTFEYTNNPNYTSVSPVRTIPAKSHPKLLLRRTESVAEKLLGNWLCFLLLFPFILEHIGEPLFILFRAIKSQLEKAPVDVITEEARNSLSEEKLLKLQLDADVVEGVVDTGTDKPIPIRLLASDTITQAKEKILDALYKNCSSSKRPQLTEVDLELKKYKNTRSAMPANQQYFVTESALYELAKYGIMYSAHMVAALNEDGLSDRVQVFEEVVKGLTP